MSRIISWFKGLIQNIGNCIVMLFSTTIATVAVFGIGIFGSLLTLLGYWDESRVWRYEPREYIPARAVVQ